MENALKQLRAVRRTSRWLLVGHRVAQWAAAVLLAAVVLGVADYLLRLPGGARMVVGLAVLVVAAAWLGTRLLRAARFRPGLSELALRAEKMYPQLNGSLASAVEFAEHPELYNDPKRTADMADAAVRGTQTKLRGVRLGRLVNRTPAARSTAFAMLGVCVVALIAALATNAFATAVERWIDPLGDTRWPRRTAIAAAPTPGTAPADTPVRLAARIDRGHREGMRVRAHYRLIAADGRAQAWQTKLMNRQAGDATPAAAAAAPGPEYDLLVELPWSLDQSLAGAPERAATLEYWFEAGDDRTEEQKVALVARPALTSVVASVRPPAYAEGLVPAEDVALHEQGGEVAAVAALIGSQVDLKLTFNKPVETIDLPGLAAMHPGGTELTVPIELASAVQTGVTLTDRHGLKSTGERRYRVDATEDEAPAVALRQPLSDLSVLATAVLPVEAWAEDDVAVTGLAIDAARPARGDSGSDQTVSSETLTTEYGRRRTLSAEVALDLSRWTLEPGDTVMLTAEAVDGYELNGMRHEPVTSAPRTITIIDEETLKQQLWGELSAVGRQAEQLGQKQKQVERTEAASQRAAARQDDITRRIDAQQRLVEQLEARVAMNRLDAEPLDAAMEQAEQLLGEAQQASQQAAEQSREAAEQQQQAEAAENNGEPQTAEQLREQAEAAEQQAKAEQQEVQAKLKELQQLLEQGRNASELQAKLNDLHNRQTGLNQDTQELLPRTAGLDPEQMPEDLREAVDELSDRQRELAEEAEELVRQMDETARDLEQRESERDRATADAMREAAEIARQQGLRQQMQQAAEQQQQNQLSQAQQQQQSATTTMEQMMQAAGSQQQKMQERLERRIAQLAELVRKLIEREKEQQTALAALPEGAGGRLPDLAAGTLALRRATLDAQLQAEANPETAAAAGPLGDATEDQATAVKSLRAADRDPADAAHTAAVEDLEAALKALEQQQDQQEQDNADQEREELKKAYAELADRQDKLITQTGPFAEAAAADRLTRVQKRDLRTTHGPEQEAIRRAALELQDKVGETLVYRKMHERLDDAAARAAEAMTGSQIDAGVALDQRTVAAMLRAMAEALEEEQQEEDGFDQPPGDGGGGGGGGGQQEQPLVPDLAELKLLKAMQEVIYEQTRATHDADPDPTDPAARGRIEGLGEQQRELHDLGEQMLEKLRRDAEGGDEMPPLG